MKRANNLLTKSLQRLSSGKRIVSPSDDAGGLAVGMKLQSSLKRAAASRMNTQNGVSFLQMQDGVMKVGGEILDRMSELKSFYNDISKNATDRETYNHEFHELQKELNSLKGQKLNGVSLFASSELGGKLGINTSDDGLGENIQLKRTGFFENLKSKFGADSVLNSGSQGSYRQLVGDFSRDGGVNDPQPGNTSRAYGKGQVVYKTGIADSESGYFMATKDVGAGTKIIENGANTNWLRVADKSGNGFVEAFPEAAEFDPFSLKRTSKGRQMSYLKGDVVKVPAHWDSAGSYFYLKAETDVPYGKTLNDLYNESQIGPGKFFDYVGENANGIPTTDFVRANSNLPDPSLFNPTNATSFVNLFSSHLSNNYTPGHVKVEAANDPFLNGVAGAPAVVSAVQQVDTITGIVGGSQAKQIDITNIKGDQADAYNVTVSIGGLVHSFTVQDPATGVVGNTDVSNLIRDELNKISISGGVVTVNTVAAATPALTSTPNTNNLAILANAGVGDFNITVTTSDNSATFSNTGVYAAGAHVNEVNAGTNITYALANKVWGDGSTISAGTPAAAGDVAFSGATFWTANAVATTSTPATVPGDWTDTGLSTLAALAAAPAGGVTIPADVAGAPGDFVASATVATTHAYLADEFSVNINGTSVTAKYDTDAATTAKAIVDAINSDSSLSSVVTAAVNGNNVSIMGNAPGVAFTLSAGATDVHNNSSATNPVSATTIAAALSSNTTTAIPAATTTATPTTNAAYGVYVPASNWGIQQWDATSSFQSGDRVLDSATQAIYEMNANVKGTFIGQATALNDLVLEGGIWYRADAANTGLQTPTSGLGSWTANVNPLTLGATNKNTEFMDLTNESIWTRTHHGELVGKTISTNYTRGDNIFYQGKHYIYTSSVESNDIIYNPDGDGYTEFEDLLSAGALMESPIYIDTRGGGGSSSNPDVFYRPNESLEYTDRLPNSGTVRTNTIERRSDSARFPGDDIFNSRDDQFYGGLNAGNDGIYGTADDFYSTTSSSDTAKAGGHIDSDADNNKDLLDTANGLENFSVADFVDYIQTLANMRAVNGGTMSRLHYATSILEENEINLGAATSRIMDADMAQESTMMARQNVLLQASASMITQANSLTNVVLSLLQ
jgi:flagellin-like hook-associated protein FlgL